MNKADLIEQIAQAAEISKSAAERAVDALVGAVKSSLRKDEMVTLVGFGTFYAAKRAARHQGGALAEVPRWKGAEGRHKLASFFCLVGFQAPTKCKQLPVGVSGSGLWIWMLPPTRGPLAE